MKRLSWWLFRARLRLEDPKSRAWDARHGVDTAAEVPLGAAGVAAGAVARGNAVYRVTWGGLIDQALKALDVTDHGRWTFVDYGSGKGKAMLMAADYPFARIVGVEYAPALHETAVANCRAYRGARQQCRALEPVLGDVLAYEPPPGPLAVFMCNPFDAATLGAVFDRWRARTAAGERELRVIYCNMRDVDEIGPVLAAQDWLTPVARARRYVVLAPR